MAYGFAMLAYACDFLYGKNILDSAAPASAEAKAPSKEKVGAAAMVGAGAAGAGVADADELTERTFGAEPGDVSELADLNDTGSGSGSSRSADTRAASRWPTGPWLRTAFVLTCIGLIVHIGAIVTRGIAEDRVPWGNMYEFISAFTCAAVLILTLAAIRFRAYYMGLFVLLPVVVALAVDVLFVYTPAGQVSPALQSYWIAIHVTAMIISIGMYIFGAVVTVLYLLAARHERKVAAGEESGLAGIMAQLPSAAKLDQLSYRAILFAFPAWTF